MPQPVVSIITPSFDREDLVAETLDCLVAQSFEQWENIVVDDGSTDRTKEVIAGYCKRDPRFKLFDRSQSPKGACTCRNEGVRLSSGKYLVFLDTDDILEPFCLEQRVSVMEDNPELDFAIFPSLVFAATPHDLNLWWNVDKDDDELVRQFRQDAICQGTGVMWRKDSFERIEMWDERLALWQDIALFFKAYIEGYRYAKFFDLPPDMHHRVHGTSLSRGGFFAPKKTKSRMTVIRDAVRLLKANSLGHRAREARHMSAEIVSGAARSGQLASSVSQISWSAREGVVSAREAAALSFMAALYLTRLGGYAPFKAMTERVEAAFAAESTIGKIAHD